MPGRAVIAALLLSVTAACSIVVPQAASRRVGLIIENHSHLQLNLVAQTTTVPITATVEACTKVSEEAIEVGVGDTLVVNGETVFRFDPLPPADISAIQVYMHPDGTVDAHGVPTMTEEAPPILVPCP